jgi:hypothetical protein
MNSDYSEHFFGDMKQENGHGQLDAAGITSASRKVQMKQMLRLGKRGSESSQSRSDKRNSNKASEFIEADEEEKDEMQQQGGLAADEAKNDDSDSNDGSEEGDVGEAMGTEQAVESQETHDGSEEEHVAEGMDTDQPVESEETNDLDSVEDSHAMDVEVTDNHVCALTRTDWLLLKVGDPLRKTEAYHDFIRRENKEIMMRLFKPATVSKIYDRHLR